MSELIPESLEVVQESLEHLVSLIKLASITEDETEVLAELTPKFLQGGAYIAQSAVAILHTCFYHLANLQVDLDDFSFDDVLDIEDDEITEVMDTLFQCYIRHDTESFFQVVRHSYYRGFAEVADWFIPLVWAMVIISVHGEDEFDGGEEDDS